MSTSNVSRVYKWSIAALSSLALAGCSMFSDPDPRTMPAPLTEYSASASVRVAWSVPVGKGSGQGFAPVIHESYIYAATPDGNVTKINASNGRVSWKSNANTRLSAGVGSDGNTTAVVSNDGTVIAFDSSGQEKWRARASSEVSIPPLVGEGQVIVRSGDYRVQAFDASSGDLSWSVQRPGPALALKTSMQMMLMDGLVITGLPNGKLMAIHADSGAVQWEGTVSVSRGSTDLERITDVVGAPQVSGNLLCGVSYQGRINCFDIASGGNSSWARNFSSYVGMGVDSRHAYVPDTRSVMYAFDLSDGNEVWRQDSLFNRNITSPAIVSGALVVGDFEGYVHVLNPSDGSLMGRLNLDKNPIVSPLLSTDHGVAVQTGNGNLVMVRLN